jgi:hypothetical protein
MCAERTSRIVGYSLGASYLDRRSVLRPRTAPERDGDRFWVYARGQCCTADDVRVYHAKRINVGVTTSKIIPTNFGFN